MINKFYPPLTLAHFFLELCSTKSFFINQHPFTTSTIIKVVLKPSFVYTRKKPKINSAFVVKYCKILFNFRIYNISHWFHPTPTMDCSSLSRHDPAGPFLLLPSPYTTSLFNRPSQYVTVNCCTIVFLTKDDSSFVNLTQWNN